MDNIKETKDSNNMANGISASDHNILMILSIQFYEAKYISRKTNNLRVYFDIVLSFQQSQ